MLTALKSDGVVFTKEIMTEFRAILNELNVDISNHLRLRNSLGKHISTLTRDHYMYPLHPPTSVAPTER